MKKTSLLYTIVLVLVSMLWSCEKTTVTEPESVQIETTQLSTNDPDSPSMALRSLSPVSDKSISSVNLMAGQTMNAGTVEIYQIDTNGDLFYDAIKVVYNLSGWSFEGTDNIHFWIGSNLASMPKNKNGNLEPGQFTYKFTSANPTSYSFVIPFDKLGFGGCTSTLFYVAAHAVVKSDANGSQTAFGAGTRTGKNWFMSYTVTLADLSAPKLSGQGTDKLSCSYDFTAPTATDNCDLNLKLTFVDVENAEQHSNTRTWTAVDANNNISQPVSQTITLDVEAPVVVTEAGKDLITCAEPQFTAPTFRDNSGQFTVSSNDVTVTDSKGNIKTTRTWTAVDPCNLKTKVSQSITLDKEAPVVATRGQNLTVSCGVALVFTTPTFTDNSGSFTVVQNPNDVVVLTDNNGSKTTTRTWVATDDCGNATSVEQTITNTCATVSAEVISGTGWAYNALSSVPFSQVSSDLSNRWGWTNLVSPNTTTVFTLYVGAGQSDISKGKDAGTVTVSYNGGSVTVRYALKSAYKLTGAHVYAGLTPLPLKSGSYTDAPGQLGNNAGTLNTGEYTFILPGTFTGNIYVAAHAVVDMK